MIPFFPIEIEKRQIDNKVTAYILATYNLSALIGSFFTDSVIGKLGRRYSVLLGMLSEGTGYILFGVNGYINHKPTYIALAITARFIQGFGGSVVSATMYSIVLNFYLVNKTRALTMIESAMCGGVLLGPALGSVLFMIGGFQFMIFSFGTFLLMCAALV